MIHLGGSDEADLSNAEGGIEGAAAGAGTRSTFRHVKRGVPPAQIPGVGAEVGSLHRVVAIDLLRFHIGVACPSLGGHSSSGDATTRDVGGGSLGIELDVVVAAAIVLLGVAGVVVIDGGDSSGSGHHGTHHGRRCDVVATEARFNVREDGVGVVDVDGTCITVEVTLLEGVIDNSGVESIVVIRGCVSTCALVNEGDLIAAIAGLSRTLPRHEEDGGRHQGGQCADDDADWRSGPTQGRTSCVRIRC
mmetsp:Transcript_23070/g.66595  ORF Transcript_23070/g.66595 Transcript_23070/m.66595 type:complete len:248 (+) Transcript_23070:141-884(+)